MADTALSYSIFANDRTAAGLRSAGSGMEKFGGAAKKILGGLAVGAAIGGVASFAKGIIADARESAKVSRMTEAVVKSTGGAAKVTAGQVSDLSTAISNKTGVDDEAIQSGQNLLLTFTNIRNETGKGNDIFDQASQSITDMTAALNNGDVSAEKIKGSSVMLGKALNDPVKGITALSRAGVSFTEGQKKQITEMVKAGDTMGAQKIILGELKKEFGGAAAAASDPAQKAGVAWGNLREEIGGYLLPVFNKLATFASGTLIPAISKGAKAIAPVFRAGAKAVQVFMWAFKGESSPGEFNGTLNKINRAGIAMGIWIRDDFLPAARRFGSWIKTEAIPALKAFAQKFWQDLQPAIHQIVDSFNTQLKPALQSAIGKFREAWPTIQRVLNILGQVAGFIMTRLVPVLIRLYAKYLATVIRVMSEVFKIVWKVIGAVLDAGSAIGRGAKSIGDHFAKIKGYAEKMKGGIVSIFSGLADIITAPFRAAVDAIKSAWNSTLGGKGFDGVSIPFAPDIPGFHIPYLADGGIVSSPTLAMIGEAGPEAVVPLSRGRAHGIGGGGEVTVRFVVDGTDADLKKLIQKMVRVDGNGSVQVAFGRG